ncbi:MAG: Holliday junction resolvase RuvX [bacterium]
MNGNEHVGVAVEQVFIGVDPGEKRVGIAYKPAGSIHAEPLVVLENGDDIFDRIIKIAQDYKADCIIVGLPRDSNGNDTTQTKIARGFGGDLADASGMHVIMYDEFDTSHRARVRLGAKTRAEEKKRLDAFAAAILIEDYLEGLV